MCNKTKNKPVEQVLRGSARILHTLLLIRSGPSPRDYKTHSNRRIYNITIIII